MKHARTAIVALIVCLAASPAWAAERISYNRDVRPILSAHCFACHGPDVNHRKKGLRLDEAEVATAKLDDGRTAIVPGDAEASELVRRIFHADPDERMPPAETHKPLSEAQKATLRAWVAAGAEYEPHWSFVTPVRPQLPAVKRAGWVRNAIDRFVLARLEAEGLDPSPEADPVTLIRRVTLDLTGLPPTPEEVDAFVADTSADLPGAYEKLVDRLLASEHYGERMALPWLDAARYADTNGFSIDDHREMWAWRDWVIDAFNTNMPFDRFTVEQLAGDLLPDATDRQRLATGFLRNSMNTHEGGTIAAEYRVIYLADKVDTVASAFLGLTVRCAQCHNHKYDPITQEEYYRFYAYFDRAQEPGQGATNANTAPTIAVEPVLGDVATMRERLNRRIATLRYWSERLGDKANHGASDVVAMFGDEFVANGIARKTVDTEIAVLEKVVSAGKVTAMVMQERPNAGPTYLLTRGAYDQPDKSKPLAPGTPGVLPAMADDAPANRLGLARWLVDAGNPLTARVAVNRWWQTVFGTGLVASANDLGTQGQMPSHPELLDWLARQYADGGWDTKAMMRLIVTSATYRQSSHATAERVARDPGNRLLGRGVRFRLPAELVRDNALAIGGLLVREVGGPSVYPQQPPGMWREISHFGYPGAFTAQVFVPDRGEDRYRRSMYTFWKRTGPPPGLAAFDAPTREVCTITRATTNTPLQSLVLLNDPQFVDAARGLALRAMREAPGSGGPGSGGPGSGAPGSGAPGSGAPGSGGPGSGDAVDARIVWMFRLAAGRSPDGDERAVLRGRYERAAARYKADAEAARALVGEAADASVDTVEQAAYTDVAAVVLNLDEVITKE